MKVKKDIIIIITFFILFLLFLALFIFSICFYKNDIPYLVIVLLSFLLISYLGISIFNLYNIKKFKNILGTLEATKLHNKSLQNLYDSVRTFKHDFFNIIQSIDGYIKTGDASALCSYYNEIKFECNNLNNLSALDPNFIDDAAMYNLIATKYYKAADLGISFDIHFLVKLSSLNISSYVFSRILGILLDNAIEAATSSKEKQINLEIVPVPCFDTSKQLANIIIENTYSNKDVDLDRICEKGFTSKLHSSRLTWFGFMECCKNIEKI